MFEKEIHFLKDRHLYRFVRDRESPQGNRIIIGGRELVNFASNDYLGFANHQDIVNAAIEALREYGSGSGASRLLSGGSIIHRWLEERMSRFKETEDCLLFNSGYAANTGVIPALAGDGDLILSDELNHASIIDGCKLSKAKTLIYRHRDVGHIEHIISRERHIKGKIVIITDSVFSMDGDIAPLRDIYNLCLSLNNERGDVLLYIDDAHGTGVLGGGKGVLRHLGLDNKEWIIQMGTFSKALGSYGAFVAGSGVIIDWLRNRSRSFIFSTALPAFVAASSLKALELLEKDDQPIKRLWSNRERLIIRLGEGYRFEGISGSETPIVPVIVDDIERILSLSRYLEESGIYVPAIRPPTVKIPRLRITITASHSEVDIDRLVDALNKGMRNL